MRSHRPDGTEWRIANATIYKVLAAAALCAAVIKLAPLITLIALAILLACTLQPAVVRLERYLPHWAASLSVTLGVLLVSGALVWGVIPSLVEQISAIAANLPDSQTALLKNIPAGASRQFIQRLLKNPSVSPEHVLAAGQMVVGAASELILIVVFALYLASDGRRTYAWLRAFFSPPQRKKLDETVQESTEIIVAYVAGQVATSALCAIFVFAVLTALRIPGAVVLSVLAAVFDILPMVGFFLFAIPAVLFALAVSVSAALKLLALYTAYHFLENYVIVPAVYGNRLRLSDLVVLIAVLAGASLGGIAGAILVLPLAAVYPAVERIWLADYIGHETVEKHDAVEHSPAK